MVRVAERVTVGAQVVGSTSPQRRFVVRDSCDPCIALLVALSTKRAIGQKTGPTLYACAAPDPVGLYGLGCAQAGRQRV